jgi:alanyl-tRNA synthetase
MKSRELKKNYIEFFKSKGHMEIPNASLVPQNDPTVLFTTAGMHPLVPYLLGQDHPLGKRLTNVQKCIRTVDIDEVGDTTHHTFLEMLGNWSLGDYWKKEAIEFTFEFLTKVLKMPKEKLAVTCFKGDENAPRDAESEKIWRSLKMPKDRIAFLGKEDNWWGPAGLTGPCGPSTEVYYWKSSKPPPKKFIPSNKNWVEIGNDVLMEYSKTSDGSYVPLKQKNVDFGGGMERILAVMNNLDDNYMSELFLPIIKQIEKISGKQYKGNERAMRIIADHIKASVFILGDGRGIRPSNVEHGYILRRLIRRAIRHAKQLGIETNFSKEIAPEVIKIYSSGYQELERNKAFILAELETEEERFKKTLENGLKKFSEVAKGDKISGKDAFLLFQSYGFPIEMTEELASEKGLTVDRNGFDHEFKNHQELSRKSTEGIFRSGLADQSEATVRLHTATHLLNEALRQSVSTDIKQRGSNITPERLRFDFNFPRKLTAEEIKKAEDLVNKKIQEAIPVKREEMPLKQALSSGAQSEFGAKYPEIVSVYSIGSFSMEICTGPHVKNTKEIGHFRIVKEEAVAAGIRRIKAVVE